MYSVDKIILCSVYSITGTVHLAKKICEMTSGKECWQKKALGVKSN